MSLPMETWTSEESLTKYAEIPKQYAETLYQKHPKQKPPTNRFLLIGVPSDNW